MILPGDHAFAGLLKHGYRCFCIDSPTRFVAGTKGRPQHYKRMTDHEIAALPVADLIHPDGAWFFIWWTSPKLYVKPGSRTQLRPDQIAQRWHKQLRYSGRAFEWIKLNKNRRAPWPLINVDTDLRINMGYTTRKNAEDCLLFRIGKPVRLAKDIREPIISPQREHSRKPDESYARIERFCAGPRLELFAREHRPSWHVWGNEVDKFDAPRLDLAA